MFRFTIRDLLWLTVVVGLAVGWWHQQRDYQDKIFRYDVVLDDISASGMWSDAKGRILTIGSDDGGNPKIIPMQKDASGKYVPISYP